MKPAPVTERHLAYWRSDPTNTSVRPVTFTAPPDTPECEPVDAVATQIDGQVVVRIPWKPDEIDLAHLARGGTLWLSTWGGLPPHMIEVQEP